MFLQARAAYDLGDLAQAETSFRAAATLAEATGQDKLAWNAWIQLMLLVGDTRADPGHAAALSALAEAALERLGGDDEVAAHLETALAAIDRRQRNMAFAAAHGPRALELTRRAVVDWNVDFGKVSENLGLLEEEQGHLDWAIQLLHLAFLVFDGQRGSHHAWGRSHAERARRRVDRGE